MRTSARAAYSSVASTKANAAGASASLEAQLQQEREQAREARLMFRQIPGSAWSTDRELRIKHFLGEVTATVGIAADRIVGMTLQEILGTQDPTDIAIANHLAALLGRRSSFRYRFRNRMWYEVHVEALRDDGGQIIGCIGAAVNVTGRVAAEEEQSRALDRLAHAVSLLEATIESTADGLLVVDPDGKVVTHNQRFLQLWRIPKEIADRGDDHALLEYVLDQLSDPEEFLHEVRDLYGRPDEESFDVLRFKDGRVFERYSRAQRVGDESVGRVWSFRDVTERERLLARALFMADASRLLTSLDTETALESVAHLAVPLLGDGCAIDVFGNGAPRRLLAISRDPDHPVSVQLPGPVLSGHSLIHESGGASYISVPLFVRGYVGGVLTFMAAPHRTYSGADLQTVEELAHRAAISLENARLYRATQDAVHAREEFLAVAAHEIRGPLTSIRLTLEMLRDGQGPNEKLFEMIARAERRLARLVDDLLDLGRVQGGRLQFVLEEVDLAQIVRDVAARMAPELTKSGSPLSIRIDHDAVGTWDRSRIDQIATNLLANAIKFGLGKPIEIAVGVRDGAAILAVTDQGIGIHKEMIDQIFEPFERAVPARHYGGLGLGLYIVRSIVRGLGGTINVRSAPGEGATFEITLPIRSTP
jgi:PAS domain S-box-containing protein